MTKEEQDEKDAYKFVSNLHNKCIKSAKDFDLNEANDFYSFLQGRKGYVKVEDVVEKLAKYMYYTNHKGMCYCIQWEDLEQINIDTWKDEARNELKDN